ncbi:endonuclease/exonuclease/phosphatase family protein [[Mycoplasma] anseris]|nr:endonuclease/exonuclease/phosphatase family protein [[Mycoplasma] anseris]
MKKLTKKALFLTFGSLIIPTISLAPIGCEFIDKSKENYFKSQFDNKKQKAIAEYQQELSKPPYETIWTEFLIKIGDLENQVVAKKITFEKACHEFDLVLLSLIDNKNEIDKENHNESNENNTGNNPNPDPTPNPNPHPNPDLTANPNPSPEPTPTPENPDANRKETIRHKLLWGHWNVLNESGNDDDKAKAKASIIKGINYDLIGLTEIKNETAVAKICNFLNEYVGFELYDYIQSKKLKSSYAGKNQAEIVGIIYKKDRLRPIPFTDNKIGDSYIQVFRNDIDSSINFEYARPPYGVKFEWFQDGKEDFTFIFDHFDSPGTKSGEPSAGKGQGVQEVAEASHISNVMDWFDQKDGENEDIFFAGDTNISYGNFDFAFNNMKNYKSALADIEENKSSLATKFYNYTNTYDKILYKTKWTLEKPFVYDLWSANKDPNIAPTPIDLGFVDGKPNASVKGKRTIRNISDHAPIGGTIVFDVTKTN